MDIHRGRGNANKLMNRLLMSAMHKFQLEIHAIEGGTLRNAIPRESVAKVYVDAPLHDAFVDFVRETEEVFKSEYSTTDPDLEITLESADFPNTAMDADFQKNLLRAIYACPNGIYRMSSDIEGLVQTSNNVAQVHVEMGKYEILCLTRSSVDSEKMDEAEAIKSVFELIGADVKWGGSYPGWTPKPGAKIVQLMSNLYKEMFDGEADVSACHAGLECGILGTNYPDMEMISFGPNIRGAHSPDEKVQISSVQKFWGYLLEVLKRV